MGEVTQQMSSRYNQLRSEGLSHKQAFSQTGKEFQSTFNKAANSFKTKSIFDKPEKSDGKRVSVMRWHYPEEKYKGRFAEWKREFAPSPGLLRDYKNKRIDWNEYEKRYVKEMEHVIPALKNFAEESRGKVITLLCAEKTDERCHRRLLKGILDGL